MPIFLLAWFFVSAQMARAAEITVDTLWSKSQSPILVSGTTWLKPGINLTIEPGVVIKFNSAGLLTVSGKLTAIGTKDEPIVFTSIKDDASGGDTNGDGDNSQPAPGDWNYLSIGNAGEANLDYVNVQYGGGVYNAGAITSYRAKLNIANSIITKNNAAIALNQGTSTISHSFISNNIIPFVGGVTVDAGISNNGRADVIVNASDNWWGTADGPCPWRSLLPPGVPIWQVDIKAICGDKPLVDLGVVYEPWLTQWPEAQAEPDPVVLIPGIMGSWNIAGRWQIDPIFHTYDNLMEALIAAGYKEDGLLETKPTLFAFPYDWRADNNLTAGLLKEKIQQVKVITGKNKVDIIAHSMGGLVTRSYVQGSDYQNDIDQVIFLGTPHLGSLESYLKYEGADGFFSTSEKIVKYLFQIEAASNGYLDLTDYIRAKVLSAEQLLPTFDYLKDKLADNSYKLRTYPLNYPQNNYLEDLNSPLAINLLKQRVRVTNIISDLGLNSTLNFLKVVADPDTTDNKWQSGYPENLGTNLDGLEMGNGDDTVPLYSARGLSGVETLESASSGHTGLPTVMQKEIIKALTGIEPTDYFNNTITATIKRWFFFRVYSPVDFIVVAPDGKKIGKDFLANTEINEIPDAFYSGFSGDEEFVLIPNPLDGEYKIEIQGVNNGGEYTLVNSVINNNNEVSKEFSGQIATSEQKDFNITYEAAALDPLSDLEPVDNIAPTITISKPLEGSKYLHSDNLEITYSAIDDFSGLASTTIAIDGQAVATATIDLFYYQLGTHNIVITASDKAGNRAEAQVSFEIIASIESTISDIKEVYEQGWLKSGLYRLLLENAFKLLKIEIKYFDKEQELTEKLIEKTQTDKKLNPKQKQKLIDQYNKKLRELKLSRAKAIDRSLDVIDKLLNQVKKQKQINKAGYDIIISDISYLRINL